MKSRSKQNWKRFSEDADDLEKQARMRPRTSKSSKNSNLNESFEEDPLLWDHLEPNEFVGRVVEVHKRYAFVSPEPTEGDVQTRVIYLATVARKFLLAKRNSRNFIVVGDRVRCEKSESSDIGIQTSFETCIVKKLGIRKGVVARRDPHNPAVEHILASNVDQMVIVASYLNPKIKWGLIDRYLVLAEIHSIKPIILLNKRDLLREADESFQNECKRNIAVLREAGYEVIEFEASGNSKFQKSMTVSLGEKLKGKVSMLSGHSGVGKSSIINLYEPELIQTVEENSDIFYKGRHTTSFASMIKLKVSGYMIDTPGIRSFVLERFDFRTLVEGFREFKPFVSGCKFAACRHIDEPGCCLVEAYEAGRVDARRYLSYRNLLLDDSGREGRAGLI